MEEQAKELRELFKSDDEQLKEVYDEIERENKKDADDLQLLRLEHKAILYLLNLYDIPTKKNGNDLTVVERLHIALQKSA